MKNNYLILVLTFFLGANVALCQDGVMWGYNVTFQFDDFNKNGANMPIKDVTFLIAHPYPFSMHYSTNLTQLPYKENTNDPSYKFHHGYNGPGGRAPLKMKCQNIFLRLSFEYNEATFEKQIPFLFKEFEGPIYKLVIQKIDLQDYLKPWSDAIAVLVEADGSYTIVKQSELEETLIIKSLVQIPIKPADTE